MKKIYSALGANDVLVPVVEYPSLLRSTKFPTFWTFWLYKASKVKKYRKSSKNELCPAGLSRTWGLAKRPFTFQLLWLHSDFIKSKKSRACLLTRDNYFTFDFESPICFYGISPYTSIVPTRLKREALAFRLWKLLYQHQWARGKRMALRSRELHEEQINKK
jgi:hypothetical protein